MRTPTGTRRFVLPPPNPGLLVNGNINLFNRPRVWNAAEHGFSSVFSTSFEEEGREILIPQVIYEGGRWFVAQFERARRHYRRTGRHLGIFDSARHATSYAKRLHLQQQRLGTGG